MRAVDSVLRAESPKMNVVGTHSYPAQHDADFQAQDAAQAQLCWKPDRRPQREEKGGKLLRELAFYSAYGPAGLGG